MKTYQKPTVKIEQFIMNQAVMACDAVKICDLSYEEQLKIAEEISPELYEMLLDEAVWESWTEEDKNTMWESLAGETVYKYCYYTMNTNVFQS